MSRLIAILISLATLYAALAAIAVSVFLPSFYSTSFYPTPLQERSYLALTFTAVFILVQLLQRKPRAREPGQCPACGYDLRATPDRCPECGAAPKS